MFDLETEQSRRTSWWFPNGRRRPYTVEDGLTDMGPRLSPQRPTFSGTWNMDHSDRDLLERCLQGEDAAWLALAGLVRRLTGGLAATQNLDPATQEEIVQETLAECLRDECGALRRFAGRSRLTTYLSAIVIRVAARLRQEQTAAAPDDPALIEDSISADDPHLARAEAWAAIQETLPPVEHLILRLAASGYTAQEVADRLGRLFGRPWTAAAVRQRKTQAIRWLRRALRE